MELASLSMSFSSMLGLISLTRAMSVYSEIARILIFIREQVLQDIIGGDVILLRDFHQHAHPADVGIKMQLMALQIDVARQDVVQNHVLDEIAPVVFLVIILLDAVEGHS